MFNFKPVIRFIHSNPPRSIGAFITVAALALYFAGIIEGRLAFLFIVAGYMTLYLMGPSYYKKRNTKMQKSILAGDYRLLSRSNSYIEIEFLQTVLEHNSIEPVILDDELGDMPWNAINPRDGVKLFVKITDYDRAIDLIKTNGFSAE